MTVSQQVLADSFVGPQRGRIYVRYGAVKSKGLSRKNKKTYFYFEVETTTCGAVKSERRSSTIIIVIISTKCVFAGILCAQLPVATPM